MKHACGLVDSGSDAKAERCCPMLQISLAERLRSVYIMSRAVSTLLVQVGGSRVKVLGWDERPHACMCPLPPSLL